MSKRTAQGPQGSKEDENQFHMSGTPDEKPQRATAAQMANRKIKDVRGRKRAMTPSTAPGSQSFGNAFSSAPAPTFGGNPFSSTPSLQPTGFTFGQSQSFPGANGNASPGQPQQDGSAPFSFGGATQGGFGFNAPSFGQQTNSFAVKNPYVNGTSGGQPAEPAQPAQPTGLFSFGGNSPFNAPPVTQPSAQSSGMFGAPQTTSAPTSLNMFGKPPTTVTGIDSMQTSPDAKPKASAPASAPGFQNRNLFGATSTPSLTPSVPSAPAANPFTSLNVASTTAKPAETPPLKNLFGPAAAAPKVSEPSQPTANNVFAPKTTTEQAPSQPAQAKPFGSSLFGSAPTTAKTSESQQSALPSPSNIFAPKPAAESAPAKPAESNPFGNIFAGAPGASKAPEPSTQPAPSNMFAGATASKASEASTQPPPSNIFAGATASKASEASTQPASSNMFAGATTSKASEASTQPASSNMFAGATTSKASEASTQPAPSNIFAPKPATGQNPFANLMGGGTSAPQATQPPAQSAPKNLFAPKPATAQAASQNQQPFGNLFGAKPAAPTVPAAKETSAPAVPAAPPAPPAPSFQLSKPQLPSSMNEEQAEDAELLLQLRTLNESFKQGVSKRNATDDFDSLIMYYLQVRETLGVPVFPNISGAEATATNGPVASAQDDTSTANVFANSFSAPKSDSSKPPALAPVQSASTPSPAGPAVAPPKFENNMFAKAASNASTSASTANADPSQPSGATTPAPALAIPKFGNGASGTDFMAQFKKQAEKTAAEEKAKRKAEDFDSDEDDEEEWERKDAERQREKREKIEAASKKKTKFVPGKGFIFVDDVDEPAASTEAAKQSSAPSPAATPLFGKPDEASKIGSSNEASVISNASSRAASPATSIFASANQPLPNSQNIFGSLSGTPQTSDKDDGESSSGDDIHEAIRKTPKRRPSAEDGEAEDDRPFKRTTKSSDGATSKSSLDTSLPPPSAAAGRSLFDRVQTPGRSATSSPNPFGVSMGGNATTNNTASSLFTGVNTSGTSTPLFGASQTADQTWKPNTPIKFAAESLPSTENVTSADVTGDEEEGESGAIFNLTNAKAGEEEEDAVYECRARAFKRDGSWKSQGTGICRLLVHRETHAARVVIRADPGGNIILNTHLKRDYAYSKAGSSVQLMVPHHNKPPEHWAIRAKPDNVNELFSKIEEIKN